MSLHRIYFHVSPLGPFTWLMLVAVSIWVLLMLATVGRRKSGQSAIRVCPNCGTSHPSHARFCRNCGQQLV